MLYVLIVLSVGLFLGLLEMYVIVELVGLMGLVRMRRMWIVVIVERMRMCRVVNVAIDLYLTSLMMMYEMAYCC